MIGIEVLQLIVTAYATLWALYLLLLLAIASLRRPKARPLEQAIDSRPAIAVIVPAGNAERVIPRCLQSLRACNYPTSKFELYVIADHCQDNTAETAEHAGANVLTRNDGPRGKTYATAWALNELTSRGIFPDLYLIVDATALVEHDFLVAIAQRWQHGEDIISSHSILSTENGAWYARCLGLMLVHRNLQCLGRERLGLSALLEGRGMAYSRRYIQRFGWLLALPKTEGSHPTEDWRHAVRAVEEGYRVSFADDARVSTPLRNSLSEATQQGARWERGRLINAGTYAIRLLWRGLCQRNPVKLFAALDAMQPPVAILAAFSAVIAALTYFLPSESLFLNAVGYLPVTLVVLYGMVVVIRGRRYGIGLSTVIWGPIYVIWRCLAFVLAWVFLDRMNFRRHGSGVTSRAAARTLTRSQLEVAGPKNLNDVARDAR